VTYRDPAPAGPCGCGNPDGPVCVGCEIARALAERLRFLSWQPAHGSAVTLPNGQPLDLGGGPIGEIERVEVRGQVVTITWAPPRDAWH
jgi:hypothetical protein